MIIPITALARLAPSTHYLSEYSWLHKNAPLSLHKNEPFSLEEICLVSSTHTITETQQLLKTGTYRVTVSEYGEVEVTTGHFYVIQTLTEAGFMWPAEINGVSIMDIFTQFNPTKTIAHYADSTNRMADIFWTDYFQDAEKQMQRLNATAAFYGWVRDWHDKINSYETLNLDVVIWRRLCEDITSRTWEVAGREVKLTEMWFLLPTAFLDTLPHFAEGEVEWHTEDIGGHTKASEGFVYASTSFVSVANLLIERHGLLLNQQPIIYRQSGNEHVAPHFQIIMV